jgi:hypothetical protein
MAEEKNGCCCSGALDKALKVTVILFLVYVMLGGLFLFVGMALKGHDRFQSMGRFGLVGTTEQVGTDAPCGCSLREKNDLVK